LEQVVAIDRCAHTSMLGKDIQRRIVENALPPTAVLVAICISGINGHLPPSPIAITIRWCSLRIVIFAMRLSYFAGFMSMG